jgi:hypothetical protein
MAKLRSCELSWIEIEVSMPEQVPWRVEVEARHQAATEGEQVKKFGSEDRKRLSKAPCERHVRARAVKTQAA